MWGQKSAAEWHTWVDERLSDYVDKQLAPSERALLEQHLNECERCQQRLASLRWTIALVKEIPSPALPRSFTLPMPAQRSPAPTRDFRFASFATALATLVLIAVVGVDVITQLGGGSLTAPAQSNYAARQAAQEAVPTFAALAVAPTQAPATAAPKPTSAPAATSAPTLAPKLAESKPEVAKPTAAAKPTLAAAPPAPAALPRATSAPATAPGQLGLGSGPPLPDGKGATDSTADKARVSASNATTTTVTATPMESAAYRPATLAPTATLVPPTATLVPPSPLPTVAVAKALEPTGAGSSESVPTPTLLPAISPLRVAEMGLIFLMLFFGVLTGLLWMKRRS